MKPRDAEHMIGGYSTGSLTEAERDALFRAALEDQQLFDALADEDALRELLADPAVRRRLLGTLEAKPSPWRRFVAWIGQPVPMAATATAAVAVVAGVLLLQTRPTLVQRQELPPIQMASSRETAAQPVAPAAKAPEDLAPRPSTTIMADKREVRRAAKPFQAPPAPASAPGKPDMEAPPEVRAEAAAAPIPPIPAATPSEPPRAQLAKAKESPASPPFRYRIERLQSDGNWVQFGGELSLRDRVRLRVTAAEAGFVSLREEGRPIQTRPVEPGRDYSFDIAAANRGERTFELAFVHTAPLNQTVMRLRSAPAAIARARAQVPAEAEKKVAADANAALPASAPAEVPYSVTVRLRFQ